MDYSEFKNALQGKTVVQLRNMYKGMLATLLTYEPANEHAEAKDSWVLAGKRLEQAMPKQKAHIMALFCAFERRYSTTHKQTSPLTIEWGGLLSADIFSTTNAQDLSTAVSKFLK